MGHDIQSIVLAIQAEKVNEKLGSSQPPPAPPKKAFRPGSHVVVLA